MVCGFCCWCFNCGEGYMFVSYFKVVDSCFVCCEELYYYCVDDGFVYLMILIVGYFLGFVMYFVWVKFWFEFLVMVIVFIIGCIVLLFYFLFRLKGLIVGI